MLSPISFHVAQFFNLDIPVIDFCEFELQGDFAFSQGDPLTVNFFLNSGGVIVDFAVHDVSGFIAMDDYYHSIPAVTLVHGIADNAPNAVADALNEWNAALLGSHEMGHDASVRNNDAGLIGYDNGRQIRCSRIDRSDQARINGKNIADVVLLDLAFNTVRPDAVFAEDVIEDAGIAAGVDSRLEAFCSPFVFEPQMVGGIFLFGDDIPSRLRAIWLRIFIHVNGAILDLD